MTTDKSFAEQLRDIIKHIDYLNRMLILSKEDREKAGYFQSDEFAHSQIQKLTLQKESLERKLNKRSGVLLFADINQYSPKSEGRHFRNWVSKKMSRRHTGNK